MKRNRPFTSLLHRPTGHFSAHIEEIIKLKDGKVTLEHYEVLLVAEDKMVLEVLVTADGKITKTENKEK
jgi:hypothetical protein